MSWSCSLRNRLKLSAILSKVSTTLGLSSASMAASDREFSMSSSSKSLSLGGVSPSAGLSPSPGSGPFTVAGLNAAGVDALGDGDFALAGQKLHRAHLAQIHPHRIVGALGRLLAGRSDQRLRLGFDQFAVALVIVVGGGFLGLAFLVLGIVLVVDDV